MVTNGQGVFRSQRRDPRLALIHPEIDAGGDQLTLHAPGADVIHVDVDVSSVRCDVTLFGAPYQGIDQGDAAAEWLSGVLGSPSRLVRVPPEHDRVVDGQTHGTSGYADGGPVLIAALRSLDSLNERIALRGGQPMPMSRFRPNIVVEGWDVPYTEDLAREVTIGEAALGYSKLASRCVVTTVNQETGSKTGPEPLRTLADYRRMSAGGVAFGVKFAVIRPGRVAIGDEVAVTAWGNSEL